MRQLQTDLWTTPCDALCVTTNGTVKRGGRAVMGRGCAKQALTTWPWLDRTLGALLTAHGNHVHDLQITGSVDNFRKVLSFPVKHEWHQRADLGLIEQSARELMVVIDRRHRRPWQTVLLPRPGCGNGQLAWAEVEPVVAPILDDRVVVVWL